MDNFNYKKYLAEGFLGHPSERESKRDFKKQFPKFKGSSSQGQDFGHPDNIVSVVDDMTLTMGEDAFIAAVFKALPLEDVKRILRGITNDNPIENELGPVDYEWLKEGKLLKEVRGPIEKIELHIKKGESVDDLDQYGFETNVDDEPIEDLFDENGLSLRDMSIIYDQRGDMYLMDTEDITKYH